MTAPRPWQLACACALLVASAAAAIVPANESTEVASFRGTIELQNTDRTNLTTLAPLSSESLNSNRFPLSGNLWLTTLASVGNLSDGDIAYISCDAADYQGNLGPDYVFQQAYENQNITAVLLYSKSSAYCNYTDMPSQLHSFPIFSMTNAQESLAIFDQIDNLAIADKYFVNVALVGRGGGSGANSNNDDNNRQGQNPLGPSPSTAVAMIILYSITGIITALFLVIIVTGAVRAHRNPERYGPRNVLGRPRQSRARGLGRAILDTIPIVKFGERDPPKPTDVELGSTAEARDVNNVNTNATTDANGNVNADATPTAAAEETAAQTQTVQDQAGAETAKSTAETSTQASLAEQPSGIAPAETLAAGAAGAAAAAGGGAQSNAGNEENLGCSICTEDFEKGQDIRVLPCDHKFHPECVDPWLLNVSGTCPLCRVDLRPTTSNTSQDDQPDLENDLLAAPAASSAHDEASHRRRNALRDILSLRSRPNASPEERISALRRLRESRRNASAEVAGSSVNGSLGAGAGAAVQNEGEEAATSRRNRISQRLSNVFSGRTRGAGGPGPGPEREDR